MDYVWKALFCEFVGTAVLVFVGAGAVALTVAQGGSVVGAALAFGLVYMSLFYTWGSYSGAHFNPAVSLGFAAAGRMPWLLMLGYWVAQLLGALLGAALVAYFWGIDSNGLGNAGASVGELTFSDMWAAFLLEAVLTFILVTVVLFVTANPLLAIIAGLAIGMVLTFAYLAAGPLTGASMNPWRSLGPAIFSNNLGSYWIYALGPIVGALVAAMVYRLLTYEWDCCDAVDECGNPIRDECGHQLKRCKRPVVDACGNQVCGPCGKGQTEYYLKREHKLHWFQENPLTYLYEWMTSRGMSPAYIKQELDHAAATVAPCGVAADSGAIIQQLAGAVQPTCPQPIDVNGQVAGSGLVQPTITTTTPQGTIQTPMQVQYPATMAAF